ASLLVDLHGFHAVPSRYDPVSLVFQQGLDRLAQHLLVFDEKNRLRPRGLRGLGLDRSRASLRRPRDREADLDGRAASFLASNVDEPMVAADAALNNSEDEHCAMAGGIRG